MALRRSLIGLACVTLAVACRNDDPATADTESGTGGSSGDRTTGVDPDEGVDETGVVEDDTTDDGVDETAEGPMLECQGDSDCDDNDPCTVDECASNVCYHEPTETSECRPSIDVSYPARGATIPGASGGSVDVTGSVNPGYGEVDTLTLNGVPVTVDGDGTFSTPFDPSVGGNTLVFELQSTSGWSRRRVQSFLWSTSFREPTVPMFGATPQGILVHLDQEVIDDGDRSLPVDDVATVMQLVLDQFDIGALIDPTTPITSSAGYNVYITDAAFGSTSVVLSATDEGVHVDAFLNDVTGDLVFDCTIVACQLAGGDSTGGFTVDSIEIDADLLITVSPTNELAVTVANVSTQVNDLDISSNNIWTNFLITIIQPFIIDGIVADLEAMLTTTVTDTFGPLVQDGFSQLDISTPMAFPNLGNPRTPITVDLETDVGSTEFNDGVAPPAPSPTQSGLIVFRGGGYVDEAVTPYDNLGIPEREGCDAGLPAVTLPRTGTVEIGLTDDMLNQLMFAGWRGGMLQFPLPIPDGSVSGVTDLSVSVSGMLAPTVTDCNARGQLLAHVGDLRIDASMIFMGSPIDFVAWTSMSLVVEVDAANGGIAISIPALDWIETELTVEQDLAIAAEGLLVDVLEETLQTQLLEGLGAGGFGAIALPEIDLSATAGLPPGSAVMSITVDGVSHAPGVTVIDGHL